MPRFSISPRNNRAPSGARGLLLPVRCGLLTGGIGCVGMVVSMVVLMLLSISPVNAAPAVGGASTGGSVSGAVEGEFMRRQEQIFEAEKLIVAGDDLLAAEDFGEAVAKYSQAYNGLTPSPTSERIRVIARNRFATASIKYAEQLIEEAEFAEAEQVIDSVLDREVAPDFAPARKIKSRLGDPEWYNKARTPEHQKEAAEVQRLLMLGEGAMRLADFDAAEGYYVSALRIDRYNIAARRGMAEAENAVIGYQKAARDHTRLRMLREIDDVWESEVEISGAFGAGAGPQGGVDEGSIEQKLYTTLIERVEFDDATIEEVVDFLAAKSKQGDATGRGINFVLNLNPADELARNARVNLSLRNIPLSEVLEHVTKDTGTRFRADAFAVNIFSRNSSSTILASKTFRVPPDFLDTVAVTDTAAADPFAATSEAAGSGLRVQRLGVKDILMKQGVTFPQGANAFLGRGGTSLVVRNTVPNLELIEAVVDASFSDVPLQVEIRVTMIDITSNDLNELGFDWLLGQFNAPGSNRVFAGGGTNGNSATTGASDERTSEFPFVVPGTNVPLGVNPLTAGLRSGRQWNEGDAIDQILLQNQGGVFGNSSSLRAPGLFSVAGPFTDPQFQVVLRGLSQSRSADVVIRPSIVTRSGQRAVIDMIREFPYPTEYDPPEIPQNFGSGLSNNGLGAASTSSFPVTPAHPTAFEVRRLGTHLEVEPVIGPDNFTVELNIAPELVRFEGFINYGSPITTTATNAIGVVESVPLTENQILQPVFRTTRENTSIVVWDGATVAIGAVYEERSQKVDDKVPLLGDVPFFGRFFRSEGLDRVQRAVVIFVSVKIIDPSGQRVNDRS